MLAIEQKIERLVNALAESSDISAAYISKQIDVLHTEREEMMKNVKNDTRQIRKLDFDSLEFNEKKLIAAEFIERILLNENDVNIVWKI